MRKMSKKWVPAVLVAAIVAVALAVEYRGEKNKQTSENVQLPPIPEGYVAFHFSSSFTYDGTESDPALLGFSAELPLPHVGGYATVGIPDNHLKGWPTINPELFRIENDYELVFLNDNKENWPVSSWVDFENKRCYIYYWNHYRPDAWCTEFEELENNQWSRIVWIRYAILKGNELEFERKLENGAITIVGSRNLNFIAEDPYQRENTMPKACIKLGRCEGGVHVPSDSLYPGETILIEGVFLVPEENAGQVRIGDLGPDLPWGPYDGPWEENGPVAGIGWSDSQIRIKGGFIVLLERYENGSWVTVEKFQEIRPGRKADWEQCWTYVDSS